MGRKRTEEFRGKAQVAKLLPPEGNDWAFSFRENLSFEIGIMASQQFEEISIGIDVVSPRGFDVASWSTKCNDRFLPLKPGINNFKIEFHNLIWSLANLLSPSAFGVIEVLKTGSETRFFSKLPRRLRPQG